jgi:hypothetical protein
MGGVKKMHAASIKHPKFAAALFCLLLLCSVPQSSTAGAEEQKLYTAYNIWLQPGHNMEFINFKNSRAFIPAGTEVKMLFLERRLADISTSGAANPYIDFTRADNRRSHRIYFDSRYHPKKSIDDYLKMTFTPKPLEELTKGFTEDEMKAISRGEVIDGMSREAVLVSYGYPPEHRTKHRSQNVWTYWISKKEQKKIEFDPNGFTVNTGVAASSKTQRSLGPAVAPQAAQPATTRSPDDVKERIKVLNDMMSQGLITQEEYDSKRKELLGQL